MDGRGGGWWLVTFLQGYIMQKMMKIMLTLIFETHPPPPICWWSHGVKIFSCEKSPTYSNTTLQLNFKEALTPPPLFLNIRY